MPSIELDWPRGQPVLVACSGGSDSLALLYLLREQGWRVEVGHLDHAGRPDSHRPADFLQELCAGWQVPFFRRRLHVDAWARRYGMSWEAAAREVRYGWLSRLAGQRGALLVTGHTLDDQAETVLMRLVQGCTLTGLAGVFPKGRPLLRLTRAELQAQLRERGVEWFEDPGNQDARFLRVRLRHEVMPLLKEFNAGVLRHLGQLADDAFELRAILQRPRALRCMSRLEFDEFLHDCWRQLGPPLGVRFQRWQAREIFEALPSQDWKSWNLPGNFWAEWDGRRLSLGRARALPDKAPPGCLWRFRQAGDRWLERPLKKLLPAWGVPRRARDQLPLLVRPPHQVLAALGFACLPEAADWLPEERSGLLIVEAPRRDEQATD